MLSEKIAEALDQGGFLEDCLFEKETLTGVDLSRMELKNVQFRKCCFEGCHFTKVSFYGALFKNCDFSNCAFAGSYWKQGRVEDSRGDGSDFDQDRKSVV